MSLSDGSLGIVLEQSKVTAALSDEPNGPKPAINVSPMRSAASKKINRRTGGRFQIYAALRARKSRTKLPNSPGPTPGKRKNKRRPRAAQWVQKPRSDFATTRHEADQTETGQQQCIGFGFRDGGDGEGSDVGNGCAEIRVPRTIVASPVGDVGNIILISGCRTSGLGPYLCRRTRH